ncbi:MAG: sigma-70 family RNA polymerase sigma factor [Alphaproteobacteria bacterium]|nr:sigma-70 family RNA polymerase sigma factor [Alphaproteobacteria bacterium]
MEDIISAYKGKIRAIIKKFTGSYNEDIEQMVYIKTWRSFSDYKEQGKLSQWIGMITANVCRDYFKSKQVRLGQLQDNDETLIENITNNIDPETLLDAKTRQKIILKAVNSLPVKMRQVIILCEYENYSIRKAAEKLKISEGTVKSRLFNARQILAHVLKPLQGE